MGSALYAYRSSPLFATGPLGDYYLSQSAAGQPSDSPAVDTGGVSAPVPAAEARSRRHR